MSLLPSAQSTPARQHNATDEARTTRGKHVRIYEDDDGLVSIRHDGLELPFRAFPTVGVGISQGEVVSNKLLGAALGQIRAQQLERDEQRLAKAITRRERRLIVNNRPTG